MTKAVLGRFRRLSLRHKLTITLVGAGLAVLGVSSYLSFEYWEDQTLQTVEEHALLTAASVRGSVETALRGGEPHVARRVLTRLADGAPVTRARVLSPDGRVVVSMVPGEEGSRPAGVWIPASAEMPSGGTVHRDGTDIRVVVPLAGAPRAALLEIGVSITPLRQAMTRGARMGMVLLVGSLLAVIAVFLTMMEREVVAPIRRVNGMLADPLAAPRPRTDELGRLEASVAKLIEQGQAAESRAEAQRREMEKHAGLAQVGELAAEMAHELKRPLASVRTAIELLEQEYVLDARGQELLVATDAQLGRLGETIHDLFALAQPVAIAAVPLAPCDIVDGALMQLAGHPALQGLTVERDYAARVPEIRGDGRRLEQAVANLVLNAAEAMPSGGTLTLRLCGTAGAARIEVRDTGSGIPAGRLEQVLRPFYSTKPLGTGLGLPLVARIVAAHGGELAIDSEPGAGTTVRITLPAPAAVEAGTKEGAWRTRESW